MFTGIVTHVGRVRRAADDGMAGAVRRLCLAVAEGPADGLADLVPGESVAVDGVCLTVAALEAAGPCFDAVPETLRRTTLGRLRPGDRVHLERALRLGEPLGGHWVQGHVDGVGTVRALKRRGEDVRLAVGVPDDLYADVLPKGSIALDGVSLTVGEAWREDGEGRFSVYLVPHTLDLTTLGARRPGDAVNVEADVLGRWVRHHLERLGDGA